MRKIYFSLIAAAWGLPLLHGHTVVPKPNPMVLVQGGTDGTITIQPSQGESCIVQANAGSSSDLLSVTPQSGTAPTVVFTVHVQRAPRNGNETATVTGSWSATGAPDPLECQGSGGISVSVQAFGANVVLQTITTAQQPNAITTGDPVSTSTGEILAEVTDLSLGGPLSVRFSRYYGSMLNGSNVASALGSNWMHNFDQKLTVSGTTATVLLYRGKTVQFQQSGGNWQLSGNEMYSYQLAQSGGNYQFLDLPNNLIYTFSGAGALTAIQDRNGNTLSVTPGPNGPLSVADGLGRTLTFTYAGSHLSSVQDQAGRTVSFTYAVNSLATVTNVSGQTTSYSYAPAFQQALLASTLRPAGNTPWKQAFDLIGRVNQQTDSFGNVTSISFDQPAQGARTVTDPLNHAAVHTYTSGNLTKFTDPAGQTTQFTYDGNLHVLSRTDSLNHQTTASYDPASGYTASITDAQGNTTTYGYTAQTQGTFTFYVPVSIAYADGTSATYTYDGTGNVLTATDQAGKTITYTYNTAGQTLTATNPAGGNVILANNSDGTVATITGVSGDVTTYSYDALKRVSQITFADNTSRRFTYDSMSRPLTLTDERGKVTTLAYDSNGNLQSTTDPLGHKSSAVYDTNDMLSSLTDPAGSTEKYQYDAAGSLSSATNAAGEKTSYTYDAVNRLKTVADPSGRGPNFTYDSEGNLAASADALSNTVTFVHDPLGRTVRATSPLGETSSRTFDALGRLTSVTNPLGQTTTAAYDNRGLVSGISAPAGIAATYTHDDLGMLSAIADPNGNAWSMKYDNAGRIVSRTDPLGQAISYAYDSRNRLSGVTTPLGSVQVGYDAAGNQTQRQYTDGTSVSFTYADDNRPTGGTGMALAYDAAGRMTASNGITMNHDPMGRITQIVYGSGKAVSYTYNSRGLLAQVADWAGGTTTFTYDDAARLVSVGRSNGVTTQFGYDGDSRVTSIKEVTSAQSLAATALQRDAAGQVTAASRGLPQGPVTAPGTLPLAYDAAGQVSGFSYDSLGRLTSDGTHQYTWNLASQLIGYSGTDGAASLTYDAFGSRTSRTTADGKTENYVLNYGLGLPAVATVRSAGADQRYYVYLPGGALLYAIEAATNSHHYYHFDENGSTEFLTDDTGHVTDRYGITPYGETVTSAGSTANPFTWMGEWGVMREGSTPLYYMRFRYYDSATARFLSRDPIYQADPRAANPYQYALANPMSHADPMGLKGGITTATGFLMESNVPSTSINATSAVAIELANGSEAAANARAVELTERMFDYYEWATGYVERVLTDRAAIHFEDWAAGTRNTPWVTWEQWLWNKVNYFGANRLVGEVAEAEANAARVSKVANIVRGGGTVLAGIGTAIQTGVAVVDDVHNGAGLIVTTTDAGSTLVSNVAMVAAPPLAVADLATGGAVSGGIHNALVTPNITARVVFGRTTSQDAHAVKSVYTRFAVGQYAWSAGEYYANTGAGEAATDFLAGVLGWFQ